MKKSVGFLALIEYEGVLDAVLQVRGQHNVEKELREESWPGGCQVTVHGKAELDEPLDQTLWREAEEEIGPCAASYIRDIVERGKVKLVYEHRETEKEVLTYAAVLPYGFVHSIRWHASSGGLRLITEYEVGFIEYLTNYDKTKGVLDRNHIAMFPDEAEAVISSFKIFRQPTAAS